MDAGKRRGVVLCGAYGLQNAGDDAILRAVVQSLRAYDRDMPVTVLARRARSVSRRFGVDAVHPARIFRWLWLLGRTKLFISGGGSLLQDASSSRSLWYYLFTIWCAKKRACAVQLYGCGAGPVKRPRNRALAARVLNACVDAATLRDEESLETLTQWGVTVPARLAADPALALRPAVGKREKTLVLALRGWPGFWEKVPCFETAARCGWERYGLQPVFLLLGPGDRLAARCVCTELKMPYKVTSDPRVVERAGLVLSMRLHGLIFAAAAGTAAAGVSYDPKVAAFCRKTGLACQSLAELTEQSVCALLERAAAEDAEAVAESVRRQQALERVNIETAAELLSR